MFLKESKKDTRARLILLQLDEYAENPEYTKALIRVCFLIYVHLSNELPEHILVYPMLSGITAVEIREIHVKMSSMFRVLPFWVSLTGLNEEGVTGLAAVLKKQTGHESDENKYLDPILATFGGVPRFYELALKPLGELKSLLTLDLENDLYASDLREVMGMYNFEKWENCFQLSPRNTAVERLLAKEHLKVLHTVAADGIYVNPGCNVIE